MFLLVPPVTLQSHHTVDHKTENIEYFDGTPPIHSNHSVAHNPIEIRVNEENKIDKWPEWEKKPHDAKQRGHDWRKYFCVVGRFAPFW